MYLISAILFESASAIQFGVWGNGELSIFIQPIQHSIAQQSCFSCILFLCFSISIKKCSLLHHDIQIMAGKSKRCVRAACSNVYNLRTWRMGIPSAHVLTPLHFLVRAHVQEYQFLENNQSSEDGLNYKV